jgi:hypothetical protein
VEQLKNHFILALGTAWKEVPPEQRYFMRQSMSIMEDSVDSAFRNRGPRFEDRPGAHRGTMITDGED